MYFCSDNLHNTAKAQAERIVRKDLKMIDRSAVAQALAKAIAYKQCGKDADAHEWARKLVELLECAEILK